MATTAKYFVLPSANLVDFIDFELSYGNLSLQGQEIVFVGSTAVDAVFVRPGVVVDFTGSGAGADKIYLAGSLADYAASLAGTQMTLTRGSGADLETVRFARSPTLAASDKLVFADGTVSSFDLHAHLSSGTPLPPPSGETSVAPEAPAAPGSALNASMKAFALDSGGVTFAPAQHGINLTVVGGNGIDVVYVPDGGQVDATGLGASRDLIYFRGAWDEYGKVAVGTTITFTRTIDGKTESVKVTAGNNAAQNDQLIFADGAVLSYNARVAITADANAAISDVAGYDPATTTPGIDNLPPALLVSAVGDGHLTAEEATGAQGVVSVTTEAGAQVTVVMAGSVGQVTKTLTGTGDAQAVTLNASDLATLGDGAISVITTARDAAGNESVSDDGAFNLDTTAPVLSTATVNGNQITLSYDELNGLDGVNTAATTDFTVRVNGDAVAVTQVTVIGNSVLLTLDSSVANGASATVSYTGSGQAAIQDIAGNDAAPLVDQPVAVPDGSLLDGYIRDARIYIDTTGDGTGDHDTGVFTNASGNFFLPPGTPSGTLIAIGGINIDTGVPNTVVFKAPAGSTTVSPLTTLVQTYLDRNGGTVESAETAVQDMLGLPAGIDLLTFDPLAASATDPDALAVHKAATQVATAAMLAASTPVAGFTPAQAGQQVFDNLVTLLTGATEPVDLSAAAAGLLGDGTNIDPTLVTDAVSAIAGAGDFTQIADAQALALDVIAPAAPVAAPDLLPASDTGRLNNDDITHDTTPTVRVRFDTSATDGTAAVAGNIAKIFDGAVLVGQGTLSAHDIVSGFIDITTSTLTDGMRALTATLTDAAGNASGASATLSILIDTTPPTTSLGGLALSSDTGASANDFVTKVAAQVVQGTLSAPLAAGEHVYGSTNGGATWSEITGSVSGTTLTWNTLLRAGNHALQLKVRDTAGNDGPIASQNYTLDATPPTLSVVAVGDGNLNASEATDASGVVSVTAEAGAQVGMVFTGTAGMVTKNTVGTGSAQAVTLTADDLTTLGNGAVTVATTATDLAGNTQSSGAGGFVLDATAPLYQSASVNGDTLTLSYDSPLDALNPPATTAFTVTVNGVARAVEAVVISGNTAQLALASPVAHGDTVTVAYTDPTAGDDVSALQDSAGNDAASLPAQPVGNTTAPADDITAPLLVSATVDGNLLTLTYDEPLQPGNQPASSYFLVSVNGAVLNRGVVDLAIDDNNAVIRLIVPVSQGDTVLVSYQDPSAGNDAYALQDLAGNDAAGFTDLAVTNLTVGQASSTGIVRATFGNTANANVEFVFNEPMQASAPTGVTILKNGVGANVLTGASFSADGYTLTFHTNATLAGTDFVVVAYNGSGDLRDLSGNHFGANTLVVGGSGPNTIDLSALGGTHGTITVRGNGGDDVIIGGHAGDILGGNAGADRIVSGWGKDLIRLYDGTNRGADTVVLYDDPWDSKSPPLHHDTVLGFDVSSAAAGAANINDRIELPSGTIAADSGPVSGTAFGALAGHSIASGMLTFHDGDGAAILINPANIDDATHYLLANITQPGASLGFAYDRDNNGHGDSVFVFYNQNNGDDALILLVGVNGVTLGNSPGQNVVHIVDGGAPAIFDADFSANTFNLHFNENLSAVNLAGWNLAKGNGATLTPLDVSGWTVNGNQVAVQLDGANLSPNDYILITLADRDQQHATDTFGNSGPLFFADEAGGAIGGAGSVDIDLSGLAGNVFIYSPGSGNHTLMGNDDDNEITGGPGNDALYGGGGDDRLQGGPGGDLLDGGPGADEYRFMQGDSTAVLFAAGVYTFPDAIVNPGQMTTGVDVILGSGFTVTSDHANGNGGDVIELRSPIPGQGLTHQGEAPANGLATDQGYFLVRGNYSQNDASGFAVDVNGSDTLVVYDGNSAIGQASQTALVLLGINPTQLATNGWGNIYRPEPGVPPDTTAPTNTGASFSNSANSVITLIYSEAVTAATLSGLSFSINPAESNGWMGTPITVTGVNGLGTATVQFNTTATLGATDVVRMRYDASQGTLADLAGNPAGALELWIGGSGANEIDLDDYWTHLPVVLRGNGGNDRLVGTDGNDVLIDGGGADTLLGSWGADTIVLVENGSTIPFSRDVVKIERGESVVGMSDIIRASATSPTTSGFDIASPNAANHDVLDLPSNTLAANVANADGVDVGMFARHGVTSGIVSFMDADSAPILVNSGNVQNAIGYLSANFIAPGVTAAFKVDTDGNGAVDSLYVFQDNGTIPLAGNFVLPDTLVRLHNLIGIDNAVLGTTAGANVVQIIDTQAPEPVGIALTATGFQLDFSENAFVPASGVANLALTMQKNGSGAVLSPTSVEGNGSTTLTLHYALTLVPEDWVMMHYAATSVTNGISDVSGNTLIEEAGGFRFAEGGSGNNLIDLSALSDGYDINGNAGNDTLIGSSGDDWLLGGPGADTLTGGPGDDLFEFEQGDSPTVTARSLGVDGLLNNGDTFSFANGVDRVTDLSHGEAIKLSPAMSDVLGHMNGLTYMGGAPANGLATDQGYFVVQGTYNAGVFTVDTTAGADTLIVWDGDSSSAVTQTGIVLSGVQAAHLQLGGGYIQLFTAGQLSNGNDVYTLPPPPRIGHTVDALAGFDTLLMPFYPNVIVPDGEGLLFGEVLDLASINPNSMVYALSKLAPGSYQLVGGHDALAAQPVIDYDLTLNNFERLRFDDGVDVLDIDLANDIGLVRADQAVSGVLDGTVLAANYLFASYEATGAVSQVIGGAAMADTLGVILPGVEELAMLKDESGADPVWRFTESGGEIFSLTQAGDDWAVDYANNGAGVDLTFRDIEYLTALNDLDDVLLRLSFASSQPQLIF